MQGKACALHMRHVQSLAEVVVGVGEAESGRREQEEVEGRGGVALRET